MEDFSNLSDEQLQDMIGKLRAPDGGLEAMSDEDLQAAIAKAQNVPRETSPEQSGADERSAAMQALRAAEFAARGFTENAAGALGAIPELVSSGVRAVGGGDYVPPEGYYPQKIKEGFSALGQAMSYPVNRALGFTDSSGAETGTFGPGEPTGTLERAAVGVGRGAADVGAFMVPGTLAAKLAGTTGAVGRAMLSQPALQVAAGATGGAVTETTENPWLGLAAALGTGVGASVILRKIYLHGATTLAEKKILGLIKKIGGGNVDAGFVAVKNKLSEGGPDTALVDVLGPKGEKMARGSANVAEGEAPVIADDFITSRMAGRGDRYQAAADTFGPRRSMPVLEEKMDIAQQMAAGPHYEAAYAANPTIVSKEIDLILRTPDGKTALKNAVDMMLNDRSLVGKINPETTAALKEAVMLGKMPDVKGGVADGLNMRTLDYVKRALYDIEKASARSGADNASRITGGQRRSLTNELDAADASPGKSYAKGRAEFEAVAKEKEALELGKKFMRGDADVTGEALSRMAPAEQEAARMGGRKALGDLIRVDRQAVATKLADKKDAMWDRIRAIFPEDEYNQFRKMIDAENSKMAVERFVGPKSGSPTAGIQQDVAALGRQMPESAMTGLEVGAQLLAGHPIRALGTMARPAFEYIGRPDAKTAEGLARMLLATGPQQQATIFDALARAASTNPGVNVETIKTLMRNATMAQGIGSNEPRNLSRNLSGAVQGGRLQSALLGRK